MRFYSYNTKKMKPIQYSSDPEFCDKLIRHDKKMIPSVIDIGLEIAQEMIKKSISNLYLIDFRSINDVGKAVKMLKTAFEKDVRSRRFISYALQSIVKTEAISDEEGELCGDLLTKIINISPEIILGTDKEFLNLVITKFKLDMKQILKNINFTKFSQVLEKRRKEIISTKFLKEDSVLYDALVERFNWHWFNIIFKMRNNERLKPTTNDVINHIKYLSETYGTTEDLDAFILLLTLNY